MDTTPLALLISAPVTNALFVRFNIQRLLGRGEKFTGDVFIFIPADQHPNNIQFLNFFLKLILEHSIHLLSRGMIFRLGWWMVLDTFILLHAWKFFQMFLAII